MARAHSQAMTWSIKILNYIGHVCSISLSLRLHKSSISILSEAMLSSVACCWNLGQFGAPTIWMRQHKNHCSVLTSALFHSLIRSLNKSWNIYLMDFSESSNQRIFLCILNMISFVLFTVNKVLRNEEKNNMKKENQRWNEREHEHITSTVIRCYVHNFICGKMVNNSREFHA